MVCDIIDTIKDAVFGLIWALGEAFLDGMGDYE